tara:strand:+ start:471 stop:1217 length:747 start_codon:yes stop_codon:yes gene_type:complete
MHGGGWSASALALGMGAHPRLGADATIRAVASNPDLLRLIMRFLDIIVPDDAPTIAAACERAAPWQRIVFRAGEHLVETAISREPISQRPIVLRGEPGALLRGTVILGAAGGSIQDLRLDDAGDHCIRMVGGRWALRGLRLRCSHGASIHLSGHAHAHLDECVLGGEGHDEIGKHMVLLSAYGSVQVQGTSKRACYGGIVRDDATLEASRCVLRHCTARPSPKGTGRNPPTVARPSLELGETECELRL